MTLNLQEVARAVGAGSHLPLLEVAGWSVDTRTQNPGDVYFALRGPNHDGHDFLAAAIEKGAAAVVVERADAAVADPLADARGSDPSPDGVPSGPGGVVLKTECDHMVIDPEPRARQDD